MGGLRQAGSAAIPADHPVSTANVAPTTPAPWTNPPEPVVSPVKVDVEAYALGAVYRTLIAIGAATAPRSVQRSIGSSELGYACERRLAYRLSGTPTVNVRDPLASMMGTGFHAVLADTFTRLNETLTPGRFLIETPVVYRDIPGTCDLYDRETATVVDWKTSTLDKISHMPGQGVAANYQVQGQTYAAGLAARGEDVRHVALMFFPRDGKRLDQAWMWRTRFDRAVADVAVDRLETLRGKDPAAVAATPDRLCGWCSHYLPGSTDLSVGCPGGSS
jgi:hypothetical protein